MNFLSLYVALLGTVAPALPVTPPPAPPAPLTIEEGCDPRNLAPMGSAPRKQIQGLESDLDRRIQVTLLEERRQEALSGELAKKTEGEKGGGPLVVLLMAAVGAALGFAAASRRSRALMAVALGSLVAAGGLGYRHLDGQRVVEAERRVVLGRSLELAACHLRLTEMRAQLEHSQLAFTTWRLDETDEDLMGWKSRLQTGVGVSDADISKMHDEIVDALR